MVRNTGDFVGNTGKLLLASEKNQGERKNIKITAKLQQFKLGQMCDFGTANRDRMAPVASATAL